MRGRAPLFATLRTGIAAARDLRIRLAYFSAAVSRASLSVISAFFFLWMVQAGKEQGMTPAEALSRSGGIFVTIQLTATLWAVIVISFIDRINRVLTMAVGVFTLCGSLGIFLAAIVGGSLFDIWRPSAPYVVMGTVSGVLCIAAARTWRQTRHGPAMAGVIKSGA